MSTITLGKLEAEMADWLIGGLAVWEDDEDFRRDNGVEAAPPLPHLEGNRLVLDDVPGAVVDDALYRLEDQFQDMADSECSGFLAINAPTEAHAKREREIKSARAHARAAKRLARKIREATGSGK